VNEPTAPSSIAINPIVRFAVERRVTMAMVVLGIVVMGVLSLQRLPLEFMPTFASSSISVWAPYNSSSPEEVERLIVRPLEDILSTINGVERLTARASASSAEVELEFTDDTEMDLHAVEVRDRVDRVRNELPDDLERVYIRRFQSSDIPVLRMNLSAAWEGQRLFAFVEDVMRRRLERLEGVANVDVWGLLVPELRVDLLPHRMAAHGVDVRSVVTTIQNGNVSLSGGYVREGSRKLLVRAIGELDSVHQIRRLPLGRDGLRLEDVADVQYTLPERWEYNFLNGEQSVGMAINKASNANLLQVVELVNAELRSIQELPEAQGLRIQTFWDASNDVKKGLAELRDSGILGGALAVLFMLFFLKRVRMTLLIALAIPLSLVLTFVIMYLYRVAKLGDISINIMSLMGLMLAVGMLVDNSIVVIESIVRRRQALGEDPKTAALRGGSEVFMPIVCSTLTNICVFVPMVFLQGGDGRFTMFMKSMGLTIVIVMIASLLVSLTVVPMAAAFLLRGSADRKHPIFDRVMALYGAALRFTLRHRFAFAVLVVALLWGSVRMFLGIERSFEDSSYERQVAVQVETPRSFSIADKHALFEQLYALFDGHREELEIRDISYRYRRTSGRERSRYGGNNRIELFLTPEETAKLSTLEIRDRVEALLPVIAGVELKIGRSMRGPPGMSSGAQIELVGEDGEILELLAEQVMAEVRTLPFVKEVDSSLESGDEEIHVTVNRERALQAGLSSQVVARTIANALSTRPVTYFKSEDREVGVVVQYREEDRETLDQLKKLSIRTGDVSLPVSSLASFSNVPGPQTIEREDRRSKLTVYVETAGNAPSFAAMGAIGGIMGALALPPGYSWSFGRSFRSAQEEMGRSNFAILFALLLVYMIMAALFESFTHPLVILFSVPFAFIGVGLVMKLANQPRGNASEMGLIILAGVVVNNAIVLIDHINQLRREGLSMHDAIVEGGKDRLRPIVMTATTTILGLLPMVAPFFLPGVFGQMEGRAAFWAPIGLVILGGLTTSTFLTLMIIPTLYSLLEDFMRLVRRVARAATAPGGWSEAPRAGSETS
jgi:HAE1 family hydrophobic/amphiphilic exporter-1